MDVLKYNLVEKAPYKAPKSWAKQKERDVSFYLEDTGKVIIEAAFGDGKSMWVSTITKIEDIAANQAILQVILDTMKEPNSEWYAADFSDVRAACAIGADRLAKAQKLTVLFRETQYRDLAENWQSYGSDTAGELARALAATKKASVSEEEQRMEMQKLAQIERVLHSLNTNVQGWHYNYSKVEPAVKELKALSRLKLSPDRQVREKYTELEKYADSLYNRYMSLAR